MSKTPTDEMDTFLKNAIRRLRFDYITGGQVTYHPPYRRTPRCLPFTILACIKHGEMILHREDHEAISVPHQHAMVLPEFITHHVELEGDQSVHETWAMMRFRIYGTIDMLSLLYTQQPLSKAATLKIHDGLMELDALGKDKDHWSKQLSIQRAGLTIAETLVTEFPLQESAYRSMLHMNRLLPALELIQQRMQDPPSRDELAESVGLSLSQLGSLFKKAFRVTPVAYQRRLRLQKAQSLLLTTDLTIQEIANQCGFQDAFHFSRTYKLTYGSSPNEWRRSNDQS